MKKTILFCLLAASVITAKAQFSYSIPDSIPNYDGTYDNFGQGRLWYPNAGEIRLTDERRSSTADVVKYYSMYTHPKLYLLNSNNISLNYAKTATTTGMPDSLHRMDMEWLGSDPTATLTPVDTQNFARLYYMDQYFGSSGGRTVAGGAAVACQSIYKNIDLVYMSNNAGLVMYFIVYPGGNYKDIQLHFNGSKSNAIVSNKLIAEVNWDKFTLQKPQMYQYAISGSVVTPVTVCNASWVSMGAGTNAYQMNNSTSYNTSLPLIIQLKESAAVNIDTPGLCWSTYFGGWQTEFMTKTHTDAADNLYVAGSSNSAGNSFPQNQGVAAVNAQANDGAITKFNSAGQIQWSTFVGGIGNDYIRDFDFYGGSIFCVGKTSGLSTTRKTGATNDSTFGGTAPYDGFIFEFKFLPSISTFTTHWLTYLGGNGYDDLSGCKIDGSGNLYVIGTSASTDMPPVRSAGEYTMSFNSAQLNPSTPISTDGIISKYDASGLQKWFTFVGADSLGTNAYNHAGDYFYGVTLTGNDIYVCGKSGGTNLPGKVNNKFVAGQFDGILVNFDKATGGLVASKYTDGNIANYAVKELFGEIYTVGEANSSMSLVNSGTWFHNGTASGTTDGCFSIHTSNLSTTTTHNSFIGGSDEDGAYDLQFSSNNLLFIGGGTRSSDFPSTSLASMFTKPFQGGINDNFITCLQRGNSNILWSSCLGSPDFNESQVIPPFINSGFDMANTTLSIDSQNTLRLLGSTTSFSTFPLDDGALVPYFQPTSSGGGINDGSITCFDMDILNTVVGLKDFANTKFVFGLYPNPTAKNLSITNPAIVNNDLRYAIYDVNGKKLQEGSLKANDAKNIDVSTLPQGVYIINVSNGKMTYSNKFVKVAD